LYNICFFLDYVLSFNIFHRKKNNYLKVFLYFVIQLNIMTKKVFDHTNFLFVFISLSVFFILIYNILHYNPILGYDAYAHYEYIDYFARYLPRSIKLPSMSDTYEFFNPPLGYVVPSIAQVVCRNIIESNDFLNDCRPIYGKVVQIFQSIMYLATISINLYTLKLFNNSKSILNTSYLILVSLLAVNYRTISMVRGEPYILFFLSLFLLYIYKAEASNFKVSIKMNFIIGLTIGSIALSRQWGFLLFLPLIYLLFRTNNKKNYLIFWTFSSLIGALLSSWFYFGLYLKYGTFTPFNMSSKGFSLLNQNLSFYFPNYEQLYYFFTKPIRPYLDNQFFSILYSDLWGDYWGYFTFTSQWLDVGRNQLLIGDYFARVNIFSLFTSAVIVIFCILTFKTYNTSLFIRYLKLAILFSIIGYFAFSITYVTSSGDQIKATYIIQVFHLAVFSASIYFHKLKRINKKIYDVILSVLVLIYIHNFQSYLSHFPFNFLP